MADRAAQRNPRGVEIARAMPADAASVADIWLRTRKASIPEIPAPVHTDDEVKAFFLGVVLRSMETWVAVEERMVGLLVLDGGWVDHLYVDPPHQGRGIGAALLRHARIRRPSGLQLWTFQSNAGAQRFYERHGFVAVETTDGDNEEGAPDVRYQWSPSAEERRR